jgi:SNF2 family DNA or RNA helicase
MLTAEPLKSQLRLEIAVQEGTPWPALRIAAHALLGDDRIPLSKIPAQARATADPLDTLLLRTLLQQPVVNDLFVVGAREFASILALLRNHSPACVLREEGRIADLEILEDAPSWELRAVNAAFGTEMRIAESALDIRHSFCCAETGEPFGAPLFRGSNYWTFARVITPAPSRPDDAMLREIFDADPQILRHYDGEAAFEILFRARQFFRTGACALRVEDPQVLARIASDPLKERTRVYFDALDRLVVAAERLTGDGKPLPKITLSDPPVEESSWIVQEGRAYRLPDVRSPFIAERIIDGDAIPEFLEKELATLKQSGALIDARVEAAWICDSVQPSVTLKPAHAKDQSEGEGDSVQAQWFFEARGAARVGDAIAPIEILAAAAQGQKYLRRGDAFIRVNREAVIECKKKLREAGIGDEETELRGEQIPEMLSWARAARAGEITPWNLYVADAVEGAHHVKDQPANVRFSLDVEEEQDGDTWFTLKPTFEHGEEGLSEEELRKLVREGKKWFRKGKQWIKIDAEALEKFELNVESAGVQRRRGRRRQFYYRFRPAARDRVTEIFSLSGTLQHAQRYEAFLAQLRSFDRVQELSLPTGMTMTLRPYQKQGYEWLAFLASYGLNGILADDMGLGKTAQTIALLTRMKEQSGPGPNLIVTPTSLADNWKNEIAKFSPGLTCMIYRGSPQRRDRLRRELEQVDVVLGTYATVRNDASLLREVQWRYVILDEAHFIKNSAAATTKAIKTIPARHRLALTGTPIQNRLTELWSLFDFLMPEFLGRQMRFREHYEDPIARMQSGRAETPDEQETGEHAMERLRERIKPFVLRRLKTDVARDLPPKIENDIFCSLCPEQIALYRGFSDSDEAKTAVKEITEKGADHAQTAILAALTSLRKICNHADLMYLPRTGDRLRVEKPLPGYETRSGKLEALGELLEQCREGGHRALIFCQLTSMLDILGHFLDGMGLSYLRLDGETPGTSRQALVERFNKETNINAFLISTRAGGTGLNLTGADTVIFYDHDWNPANDQQAQDRAYRIGQLKTVNVYRLICKGTLEEKILRRQMLKKMLASSIVQHDVAGMKALTREELVSLFTFTEEKPAAEKSETSATAG